MSASEDLFSYIEPSELAPLVKDSSDSTARSFAIVDVRDDDFVGGHLPGAVNVPSTTWNDTRVVDRLIEEYATAGKEKEVVVFHCMQSKQRGVNCATKFAARLGQIKLENPDVKTEV
jgi:Cdc25 family phosphatase